MEYRFGPGHSVDCGYQPETAERLITEHDMELGYTSNDDGVWMSCACGWERVLDWPASLRAANELAEAHRASPALRNPQL